MDGIRKFRCRRGLRQRELAEMVGVTRLTIARYESGARKPDVYTLKRIAEALECTVDDLIGKSA